MKYEANLATNKYSVYLPGYWDVDERIAVELDNPLHANGSPLHIHDFNFTLEGADRRLADYLGKKGRLLLHVEFVDLE